MRKKYSVDLAASMAECEANYARLMQLLPDLDSADHRRFGVSMPGSEAVCLDIRVRERCKYTTMVDLTQMPVAALAEYQPAPCFSLRIYHDARMAEVVAFNDQRALHARYDYPNQQMFHSDEKAQLNSFLGECLSHCLRYGHSLEDPADSRAALGRV